MLNARGGLRWVLVSALIVALTPIILLRLGGVVIRFGRIPCSRYGHLAKNSDLFLRRLSSGVIGHDWLVIVALPDGDKDIANHALLELVLNQCRKSKQIFIVRSRLLYKNWSWLQEGLDWAKACIELGYNSSETEFSTLPQVLFAPKQRRTHAKNFLSSVGIDVSKPIVGVFVRDSDYLSKMETEEIDRSYHDFRDSDIENYHLAISWLIDSGMQVVRLGKFMKSKSRLQKVGYFDYAFFENKNDWLELGILANLHFIFGSASGPTDVAITLGIPFLATDLVPPHCVPVGKMDMYLPKKIQDLESGCLVPYFSVIDKLDGIFNGHVWETEYGVKFLNNTNLEITQAVKDMVASVEGRRLTSERESVEWDRYLTEYWINNRFSKLATPIAPSFLKENSELFLK